MIKRVLSLLVVLSLAATANADPLDLFYTKTSIGGGLIQYDFNLVVTNTDSSYGAGDGWNWIIPCFGIAQNSGGANSST